MGASEVLHVSTLSVRGRKQWPFLQVLFCFIFQEKRNDHHSEINILFLMDKANVSPLEVNLSSELFISPFISDANY